MLVSTTLQEKYKDRLDKKCYYTKGPYEPV